MELYLTRDFSRRAARVGLSDEHLMSAVARIERGSIDAQLGSGLIKQRIEAENRGRSRGFRAVLFLKHEQHIVFLHLFGKNEKANVSPVELDALRKLAKAITALDREQIAALVGSGAWRHLK